MVSGIVLTTLVAFLIQLSLNQTGSVPISQDGSVFFLLRSNCSQDIWLSHSPLTYVFYFFVGSDSYYSYPHYLWMRSLFIVIPGKMFLLIRARPRSMTPYWMLKRAAGFWSRAIWTGAEKASRSAEGPGPWRCMGWDRHVSWCWRPMIHIMCDVWYNFYMPPTSWANEQVEKLDINYSQQ